MQIGALIMLADKGTKDLRRRIGNLTFGRDNLGRIAKADDAKRHILIGPDGRWGEDGNSKQACYEAGKPLPAARRIGSGALASISQLPIPRTNDVVNAPHHAI